MADALIGRCKLSGMTRREVVALLGEPLQTGYFKDFDLVYLLGPERGYMSIDSEWFVMRLDRDGKVSEYRVVRD